jgi:hypothetical protein
MIWEACQGEQHIQAIKGTAWRLVESQEQVATLSYVDTLEEQALLEEMLDQIKPSYLPSSNRYHYLLKTPFRYPPLPWGSRFGRCHERGIFYAGCGLNACLADSAYYRLVFWHSIQAKPVKDRIHSEHTLFTVDYRSDRGVRLQDPPFDQYRSQLTDPCDYRLTQDLGSAMRLAGVEAFEYCSARDPEGGLCVGLFQASALAQRKPRESSQWLCELSAREVAFKPLLGTEIHRYSLSQFLVDGRLPRPAC